MKVFSVVAQMVVQTAGLMDDARASFLVDSSAEQRVCKTAVLLVSWSAVP